MNQEREDLTLDTLQWIEKKLQDSSFQQELIITVATTLQSLQLEWISLIEASSRGIPEEEQKKIQVLTNILNMLKKHGVILFDEVDQILDILLELNFPCGEQQEIDPLYKELILSALEAHLDPAIDHLMGISENRYSFFSLQEYKDTILPKVADRLFTVHKNSLKLEEKDRRDFMDWVFAKEGSLCFQNLIDNRMLEKDQSLRQSARGISLLKGLCLDVLPQIIQQSENKDFGLARGRLDRKVIPFSGVDSPSNTEFAGPYHTMAYYGLISVLRPFDENELHFLAKQWMQAVVLETESGKKKPEETESYRRFLRLTGRPLDAVYAKNRQAIQGAIDLLWKDKARAIALADYYIKIHVSIFPSYYQSDAMSLCGLASQVKGLTGTPWNRDLYVGPLRENVIFEEGVEGKVQYMLLRRDALGESHVHVVQGKGISDMLSTSLKDSRKKDKFRAIFDPSGFLRDYKNIEVARITLEYCKR